MLGVYILTLLHLLGLNLSSSCSVCLCLYQSLKSICLIWISLYQISFNFSLHGLNVSIPALSVCTCPEIWSGSLLQFSLVTQSCLTLCDPMNRSTPGLPVQQPESTQTHVHWVRDAIQPFHPLSSPSPPAFNLSQHQGLFKWASSSHQVAKVLELQLQHQSFQWTPRTDLL